jgi:hypothetical protein
MPEVKSGESRSDYMARCVSKVMDEGLDQKAAVGKCEGMYDSAVKKGGYKNPPEDVPGDLQGGVGDVAVMKERADAVYNEVYKQARIAGFGTSAADKEAMAAKAAFEVSAQKKPATAEVGEPVAEPAPKVPKKPEVMKGFSKQEKATMGIDKEIARAAACAQDMMKDQRITGLDRAAKIAKRMKC